MTAPAIIPTALKLIEEVRRVGGFIQPNPDGKTLGVDLPPGETPRLLPLLRERKADLLVLLQRPDACPECSGMYFWLDTVGLWRCGHCEPDPRAHRMRGVTLAILGDRPITTTPPTGDLPMPGSWAKTPAGATGELVLYRADGGEVLMRSVREPGRLAWFDPATLVWEFDWAWGGKQ